MGNPGEHHHETSLALQWAAPTVCEGNLWDERQYTTARHDTPNDAETIIYTEFCKPVLTGLPPETISRQLVNPLAPLAIGQQQGSQAALLHPGTPLLFRAIKQGFDNIIRLLLEHGADLSVRDKDGRSVFHEAATTNNLTIMAILLEYSCTPDMQDCLGQTPLFTAVQNGCSSMVLLLLQAGASVHVTDIEGNGALHIAVESGSAELVQMLIQHGAVINI